METRSNVVKSKSSNSAITTKSGLKESTRSNLQFQRNVIKKRGVYVENKATKTRISGPETNTKQERPVKPPPRPRPGNKRFLASVLSILSKSTAATQYPDNNENSGHANSPKRSARKRPEALKNAEVYDTRKKKKYRSRILNKSVNNDVKDQQIIVLQAQKEITHTPSIFSENDSANVSKLPSLVTKASYSLDKEIKIENNLNELNNSLVRNILEGKQMKRERRVRIEDPMTLVSINNVKTADVTAKDNNKGLYNFFVDLLETIDVCNAADVEKVTILSTNTSSTKVPLEINESVAQRLELRSQSPNHGCKSSSPIRENNFYCFNNDNEYLASQISPKTSVAKTRKLNKTKKPLHAQSFSVTKKPQSKNIKTESFNLDKKLSNSKKRKKETLLNLFKEQLKMDVNAFDEPQNLYEALKIIAENKRKCQKTIHFEERMKRHRKDSGFPECVFKRPKVLGPGKKRKAAKSVKEDLIIQKQSLIKDNERGVKRKEVDEDTNGSQYSLKVFGYDYEKPEKQSPMRAKEVVLTYHSSPSISDRGLISDDEYTDSYFNTFSRSLSINGNDYI